VVTSCTTRPGIQNFRDLPTNCLLLISEQIAIFSLKLQLRRNVLSATRTENSNKMAVNIGIPIYIRDNVLADRLTLNEFRVAPHHVRFVEDEMTVRVFLSPSGITFSPSISIPQ